MARERQYPRMDPLSDLLRVVRLDGAFFYGVEASAPWSVETLASRDLRPRVLPSAEHLISYHILIEGSCFGGILGQEQVELGPGDAIVFPHGDAHVMSSARGLRTGQDLYAETPEPFPHTVTLGAAGRRTASFVCGFLGCDRGPFNPLLSSLPRVIHAPAMSNAWLVGFTRQLSEESRHGHPGANGALTRLAELMFIEVVRRYLDTLPPGQTGWLAGLRDEVVGRVLALLHARPSHPWTLEELAREGATSRSSLAKRFTDVVGQPPMQYLTQWRMQVAANLLAQSNEKLASVSARAGYDSEAAFSRAFKKATGVAPGAWREARRTPLA